MNMNFSETFNSINGKGNKVKFLYSLVGSLSAPSKMPCSGYNIPAKECKIGKLLVAVKNSTCSGCYALKGRYVFSNVLEAMYRRFNSITDAVWIEAMTATIKLTNKGDVNFFRWHDSGDLQSVAHLSKIVAIANNLPQVNFWLPTREYKIVNDFAGVIPSNLCIRFSAHMNDSVKEVKNKPFASIVMDKKSVTELETLAGRKVKICPATMEGSNGQCNDCRSCWFDDAIIAYHKH